MIRDAKITNPKTGFLKLYYVSNSHMTLVSGLRMTRGKSHCHHDMMQEHKENGQSWIVMSVIKEHCVGLSRVKRVI